ncbi:hypothetical protein HK102_000022 [Quaeritorhiza haematococci]|nr:hypothetical protein HK102_000022 [Quaeritorhiza haematococci]
MDTILPLVGHSVTVTVEGDETLRGILLNVDPVTQSMFLTKGPLTNDDDKPPQVIVVLSHAVRSLRKTLYDEDGYTPAVATETITKFFDRWYPEVEAAPPS